MKIRIARLFSLGLLCTLLIACQTGPGIMMPNGDITPPIDNVFVMIDQTDFPDIFPENAYAASLEEAFKQSDIRVSVRQVNGLELNPITADDYKDYSNFMTIRVTKRYYDSSDFWIATNMFDIATGEETMRTSQYITFQSLILRLSDSDREDKVAYYSNILIRNMQRAGVLPLKDGVEVST